MKVYRISKCKYISDLTGYGAFLQGGRWNSVGKHMLYTSQSIALSMLEVLANFPRNIATDDFCLLTLEIDEKDIEVFDEKKLPRDWDVYPHSNATQLLGDSFLEAHNSVALKVPSGIIPAENNILFNPKHPEFKKKVKTVSSDPIAIDKRFAGT